MIGKILGSGQLGKLAGFVSPTFFEVMPAKVLWRSARALLTRSRDDAAFRRAVSDRRQQLAAQLPTVSLPQQTAGLPRAAIDPDQRAAMVVELYFHQLFHGTSSLLDIRACAFTPNGHELQWQPAPWIAEWAPEFIAALRHVYLGFYTHDEAQFQLGLRALALAHSADLFRQQFGGEQRELRFRTADFVRTFHAVFQRCKQHGTTLHGDFLPLGIYLAALYDHLQELAVAVDVAAAFERATAQPEPSTREAVHHA